MDIILNRKGKLYLAWRHAVFERDDYSCQHCCSKDNKIHAHHIKTWEEAPELRIDLDNGLTLCTICHNKHHHIGRIPHNKGKPMSLEQKNILSQIKKGKPSNSNSVYTLGQKPWNTGMKGVSIGTKKGTKFSEEHKRKLSEAASNRKITEETREKLKNRVITDERRQKLSEKTTAYWAKKKEQPQIYARIT